MARRPAPEVAPAEGATTSETKVRTPRAPRAPKPEVAEKADGEKRNRRHFGRGWLAEAIDGIFREVEAGTRVPDGPLTVSALRSLVANSQGEQPSTGAVSAVLDRWAKEGYIKVTGKPVAFNGFTRSYTADRAGLDAFLVATKARRKKARLSAKETVDA